MFVQRRAAKYCKEADAAAVDAAGVRKQLETLFGEALTEKSFSHHINAWTEEESAHEEKLKLAGEYAMWAMTTVAGMAHHKVGVAV